MSGRKAIIISSLRTMVAASLALGACLVLAACAEQPGGKPAPTGPGEGSSTRKGAKKEPGAVRTVGVTKKPFKVDVSKLGKHAQDYHKLLAEVARTGKVPERKQPHGAAEGKGFSGAPAGGARRASIRKSATMSLGRPAAKMPGPPPMAMPQAARARNFTAAKAGALADAAKVGVTTGGVQDIGQARRFITEGKVPAPEMITVEGLLSEHDIPLEGVPTGKGELYGSASVAWTKRYGKKQPEAVVQIGFGLDMELAKFKRKPLNLAVVVDVSGSMRSGRKMESAKQALRKLVERLGEKDRLAVVLFNYSAWTLLESQPVKDREAIKKKIDAIQANGGTNIESGLDLGYQLVAAHLGEKEKSPRVFLMTDACPNIGATRPFGFKPMMEGAAALGIGVSAFGVGIDFGQQLAYEIFQVRGANYFYLENADKIGKVFDDEFDFMVTPVAYDVAITLKPAKGAGIGDVLGVPDYKKESGRAEMKIPSLFLSKRQGGGATMVSVTMKAPGISEEKKIAEVGLSFVTVAGEQIGQKLVAVLPGNVDASGKTPYYSQPGAKKAVVLADAAVALKTACRGVTIPVLSDVAWCLPPAGLKGKAAAPAIRRVGPVVQLSGEQAKEAAGGLGEFADWFASQIGDVPGAEQELRLIEKLESTLRKTAGLPAREARKVAGEVVPVAPPEVF